MLLLQRPCMRILVIMRDGGHDVVFYLYHGHSCTDKTFYYTETTHKPYFDLNFTEICSLWSIWQEVTIGLGNASTPYWQLGITQTNDEPIHWRKHMHHLAIMCVNTLRLKQICRHFAYGILKCIFLYENARISLKIWLKFVPKDRINNILALVQIMAWRRPGDKPLSEPMMF